MILPRWGEEGQRRLEAGHALIVGCGALGCASAELLARAGVGSLTIVDRDTVEPSNLQRQSLFTERDAEERLPKAEAARRAIGEINPQVWVTGVVADFGPRNAWGLVDPERTRAPGGAGPVGVILDGTDNYQTRYLLNDLSVKSGVPYCYGGVVGASGMAATFVPPGACLRCVFPEQPSPGSQPTCETAGVLGPAVQIVGSYQATDALKILLGQAESLGSSLRQFDLWANRARSIDLTRCKSPDCPCCSGRAFEHLEAPGDEPVSLCGRDAVQVAPPLRGRRIELGALAERLGRSGRVTLTPFVVRAAIESDGRVIELTVFPDARAIIKGVSGPDAARSIYDRFIGS